MKWEFARMAEGDEKFIICNADEGEPGTFKDRVLLTQTPNMVLEGMTLAGYALGAQHGIIYLRGEYAYLRPFLESVLEERRRKNLLGENIYSKKGFNFDVSIQTGAGAYICGEETALISSCEGLRGDPKNRPPFPAQKGYLGKPTVVNNVETFCCITKIAERGAGWFAQRGTSGSTGTKLLSVSGDCELPGVYEVPFGLKVNELLKLAGAFETMAVQIGGPSGQMIGPDDFERTICYDDLGTGGSVMIFDKRRSVMEIVHAFTEFFVEESCGYCTPCRVGNVLLKERIERIISGLGQPSDIDYLKNLGATIIRTSRCGLGQTSANPVLTSLKNFSEEYEVRVEQERNGLSPHFDILQALRDSSEIAGRKSVIFR
jgi:[NiFe] hydrogenase diaphorase moiety large subunit